MKKIFAIALAVVMVLSIASVASAFTWSKPANSTTADNFGYSIDVIKFTRSTGELGSSYFKADDAATAVNGADVYYAIKLVKNSPSSTVEKYAKVDVTFTAIQGLSLIHIFILSLFAGFFFRSVVFSPYKRHLDYIFQNPPFPPLYGDMFITSGELSTLST